MYAVYAKYENRDQFLGICQSYSKADIEAYFHEKRGYGLTIEKIEPIIIPTGYAKKKAEILERITELQNQIKELEKEINV